MKRGVRFAFLTVGIVLMTVSLPLALLPFFHIPGIMLFAVGLVATLRNSFGARRRFIQYQRKHPKLLSPIRRLMRRKPEIFPVIWQSMLRFERLTIPKRFRLWKRLRRRIKRKTAQ